MDALSLYINAYTLEISMVDRSAMPGRTWVVSRDD